MYTKRDTQFEFIALMASLMSIVALVIDAILPALDVIGIAVHATKPSDIQLLITMIFLGFGIGPLLFGPMSDSFGRKPIVYVGFALFIVASCVCLSATNLTTMVIGRVLQGIGLSAPRTISVAMVRDRYTGDRMARIMSFVTVIFLLVPIIAPAFGKYILENYNWETIFIVQLFFAVIVCSWFWLRQSETLIVAKRVQFAPRISWEAGKEVFRNKITIGYTLIAGFITGSFLVYLSAAQQIFEKQYLQKENFPYVFGILALSLSVSIFFNGLLVLKHGMEKLVTISLVVFFAISLLYLFLFFGKENPSLTVLLSFLGAQFLAIGFLFGNLRALAMEPLGHIAGMAAALTGFISTIMAVPISIFVGRYILDSTTPVFVGFLICSGLSIGLLICIKHTKAKSVSFQIE